MFIVFFATITAFFVAFALAFPSLTGWRTLSRVWPAKRIRTVGGMFAYEVAVDWIWSYHWIDVHVLDTGIHCQHLRFITRTPFHAPILVPWSAVTEVIEKEGSIEVRACAKGVHFRVRYPAELGLSASKKQPNKAPEPTPTSVTPPASAGVAPAAVVAHL